MNITVQHLSWRAIAIQYLNTSKKVSTLYILKVHAFMQSGEVYVVKENLALETDLTLAHISLKAVFRTLGAWITQSFGGGKNLLCIT